MEGITIGDENIQKNTCFTLKCCPEKQAKFDECVKESISKDLGTEIYFAFFTLYDCCTWAHKVVGPCWNKHCGCCNK